VAAAIFAALVLVVAAPALLLWDRWMWVPDAAWRWKVARCGEMHRGPAGVEYGCVVGVDGFVRHELRQPDGGVTPLPLR
jgi:hypothetical protein